MKTDPWIQFTALCTVAVIGIAACVTVSSIHEDMVKKELMSQGKTGADMMCAFHPPADGLQRAVICGKMESEE